MESADRKMESADRKKEKFYFEYKDLYCAAVYK